MGLWGLGQLSLTKIFIVVDHDIDVHDMDKIIWAVTTKAESKTGYINDRECAY